MVKCSFCGVVVPEKIPFKCSFCGEYFCGEHRLPENHACAKLPQENIFLRLLHLCKKPKASTCEAPAEVRSDTCEVPVKVRPYHKPNLLRVLYWRLKYWLNRRFGRHSRSWNAFLFNVMWLIGVSLLFLIVYDNLEKLNSIYIWIIPFGGTILFVVGFVWLKLVYDIFKKLVYWYRWERNWVKYGIVLLLIFLLYSAYERRETLFDPLMDLQQKNSLSNIFPLKESAFLGEFDSKNLEDLDESKATTIQKTIYTPPERKEECIDAITYVNELREQYGRKPFDWDGNLYDLAVARSKDMYERNYFDHVTPDGKCVKDFKSAYGLQSYVIAENVGAVQEYSGGGLSFSKTINVRGQVDSWMESRGHRYNFLYPEHIKGAIGCYYGVCVFLGAHKDPYGLGAGPCTTGSEGLAFWDSVEKQPDEV